MDSSTYLQQQSYCRGYLIHPLRKIDNSRSLNTVHHRGVSASWHGTRTREVVGLEHRAGFDLSKRPITTSAGKYHIHEATDVFIVTIEEK